MIIKREIGEKGQVVIPKDIREYLGLDIGVNILFEVRDNEVVLKKEENAEKFLDDFLNVPKIKKKIDVKGLKKMYGKQHEEEIH